MAVEADSVVVTLLAENEQFDAAAKRSADNFAKSMGSIQSEGAAAEGAVGQFSSALKENRLEMNQSRIGMMEFQHIARGVSDQIAAGAPVTQILGQHMGMLAEAVSFSGGAFGKMGEILAGPWGIAITLASTAIIQLISHFMEAGNGVDDLVAKLQKHHDQTVANDEAQRIFDRTVVGSIDGMRKLTDEIDKQNLTLADNVNLKKQAISAGLENVESNIGSTRSDLAKAVSDLRDAQIALNRANSGAFGATAEEAGPAMTAAQAQFDSAAQRVRNLTAQLLALKVAADAGNKALGEVNYPLIEQRAKDAVNPVDAINHKFDDLAAKAKQAGTYTQAFADNLEKQRAAAVRAAEATERAAKSASDYGRQVDFASAASIAKSAGLTVTSGYRSEADQARLFNDPRYNHPGNPVARPGTSAHEGINGKWALDIAFAPGLTAQSLKKIYGDEGVSLTAVYKESGHYHIEGMRPTADVQADREALASAKQQDALWQRISDNLQKNLYPTRKQVTEELGKQASLVPQITAADMEDKSALEAIAEVAKQVTAQEEALKQMGDQFVEDVLNPDNWKSWGSIAHTVLNEIMSDLERLVLINPLENLINGNSSLPTLSSIFSLFGGGGGSIPAPDLTAPVPVHLAGGGVFKVNGGTDTNTLSINGQPRAMVSGDETVAVIPNNAVAASPSAGGQSILIVKVEPNDDRFDAYVQSIAGPLAAQAGTSGAFGGAALARNNLARRQIHQLGSRG